MLAQQDQHFVQQQIDKLWVDQFFSCFKNDYYMSQFTPEQYEIAQSIFKRRKKASKMQTRKEIDDAASAAASAAASKKDEGGCILM